MPINIYGKPIFCGYARGKRTMIWLPIAASQVFKALSAKCGQVDSNNDFALSAENDTAIFGWAEMGEITSSSTAGADKCAVDISMDAQYWVPADATVTEAMRGETCDIIVSTNIIKADVGENNQAVFLITEVDTANQYVMVKIADGKQQAKGVA